MSNVILLNNHVEYLDNGNIAIVGTTLWSHDVRVGRKFQQVTNRWHREDKHWLGVMLSKHMEACVITYYVPSFNNSKTNIFLSHPTYTCGESESEITFIVTCHI